MKNKLSLKNEINKAEVNFHNQNLQADLKGKENFDKNLSRMNAWERNQKEMSNREVEFFKSKLFEQFDNSKKESLLQIDVFDRNMSRLGLDITTIDPRLKKSNKTQMSSEMLMQKIKEKLEANQLARKENERRQRKIFYEQNKAQEALEKARKFKELEDANTNFSDPSKISNIVNSEKVKHEIDKQKSSHLKQLEFERWRFIHDRNLKTHLRNKNFFERLEFEKPYDGSQAETFTYQRSQLDLKNLADFNKEQFYSELHSINVNFFKKKLEKKKKKQADDMILLNDVMESILDLVDECYEYQKTNERELIDVDSWTEYMDLFIQNKPINKYKYFVKEKKEEESEENKDPFIQELVRFGKYDETGEENKIVLYNNLDEELCSIIPENNELLDYEFYAGIWKDNLFEENSFAYEELKVNDVITNEKELTIITGFKQNYLRGNEITELKVEHREYLKIPKEYKKNLYYGEMIQTLLELKYVHFPLFSNLNPLGSNIPIVYDPVADYKLKQSILEKINVRVCLVGHKFSGKKTIAKMISELFPWLKIYNIYETLEKYFEILKKVEEPIENHPKFKTMKKPQIEQLQKEKEIEEAKIAHVREKITTLRDQRENGENMDSELIIDMLLETIFTDFKPNDSEGSESGLPQPPQIQPGSSLLLYQEYFEDLIQKNLRKAEIQEELAKIKEEQAKKKNAKQKEEQQFLAELNKLNSTSYTGFVLVDFPANYEQAKLFETKLSNFIPEIEREIFEIYKVKDNFSLLYESVIKHSFSKPIPTSSLNKIILLDCDIEECVRRSVLRRVDPDKGVIYHLDDNHPPSNDNKLLERLKPIDDAYATKEYLESYNFNFDFEVEKLEDYYDIFRFYSNLSAVQIQTHEKNITGVAKKTQTPINNTNFSPLKELSTNSKRPSKINLLLEKDDLEKEKDKENGDLIGNSIKKSLLSKIKYSNPNYNPQVALEYTNIEGDSKDKKDKKSKKDTTFEKPPEAFKYKTKEQVTTEVEETINSILKEYENKEQELLKMYMAEKEKGFNQPTNNLVASSATNKDKDKSTILLANNNRNVSGKLSKNFSNSNLYFADDISQKGEFIEEDDFSNICFKMNKKITEFKKKTDSVSSDILLKKINENKENFEREFKKIFYYLNRKQDFIINSLNNFQDTFMKYITRPSNKKDLINEHKKYHNNIVVNQIPSYKKVPDLKAKIMENLHIYVDKLNDRIWEIIEKRKNESINELDKIRFSGWMENEMEKFYIMFEKMMFLEVKRFLENLKIFREFYSVLESKISPLEVAIPYEEIVFSDLENFKLENEIYIKKRDFKLKDTKTDEKGFLGSHYFTPIKYSSLKKPKFNDEMENEFNENEEMENEVKLLSSLAFCSNEYNQISSQGTARYPKIDKIFKNCIRILFKIDELNPVQIEKKNISDQVTRKVTHSKLRKQATHQFGDMNYQYTETWEEEYRNSIKAEKTKYRFKITRLRHWAIKTLFMIRSVSEQVFSNLDEWIIKGVLAENNAMNFVIGLCRQGIENETSLRFDEELDYFNIFEKVDIVNLINDYMNVVPSSIQVVNNESTKIFSINELKNIIQELRLLEVQPNFIYSSDFIDFYVKKLAFNLTPTEAKVLSLMQGIPQSMKSQTISFENYNFFCGIISENR